MKGDWKNNSNVDHKRLLDDEKTNILMNCNSCTNGSLQQKISKIGRIKNTHHEVIGVVRVADIPTNVPSILGTK